MDERSRKDLAWIGDAVLGLFVRQWLLHQPENPPFSRQDRFIRFTSNAFLSSFGEPTEVEARTFYTVRRGDTLVRIANRFDIDLNALVEENGIADPTKIYVGQQLLIPPPPDEDEGPLLTIAPPTDPDLPPILPSIKFLDDSEPSG